MRGLTDFGKIRNTDTPFWYYDMDLLRATVDKAAELSRKYGIGLHYAVKANVEPRIVQYISSKGFTRDALARLGDFSVIRSFGYSFQMEMNYRMAQMGLKLKEIPIVFSERRAGTSKISGSIATETLKMVFRLRFGK